MRPATKLALSAFVIRWLSEKAAKKGETLPALTKGTHLFDSGATDSFSFLDLLTAIEDELGIEIDFSGLSPDAFVTFEGLVAQCARAAGLSDEGLSLSAFETESEKEKNEIARELVQYNLSKAPETGQSGPLVLTLRDPKGKLFAGLAGSTGWQWLYVSHLWVAEKMRGQGIGETLLALAEAIAIHRGCRFAWLDTFQFQAPGFYEKQGYEQFATLPDYPPGHARLFFRKELG